jgi:hypothetical protein
MRGINYKNVEQFRIYSKPRGLVLILKYPEAVDGKSQYISLYHEYGKMLFSKYLIEYKTYENPKFLRMKYLMSKIK